MPLYRQTATTQAPARKQLVALSQSKLPNMELTSEWRIFQLLDKLRSTAVGLDQMPAWFLRLGAPVFYKPLTRLFNLSIIATSTVPVQWKVARIRPIPKVSLPSCNADFRPISVTPVLARLMEKVVIGKLIYSALLSPPPDLTFADQFAFQPSGSTTATLVYLLAYAQ